MQKTDQGLSTVRFPKPPSIISLHNLTKELLTAPLVDHRCINSVTCILKEVRKLPAVSLCSSIAWLVVKVCLSSRLSPVEFSFKGCFWDHQYLKDHLSFNLCHLPVIIDTPSKPNCHFHDSLSKPTIQKVMLSEYYPTQTSWRSF